MNSIELRNAIRSKFAWPGGYPMFIVMADGEALCMDCARVEYRQIARASRYNLRDCWQPAGVDINYEDSELCCCHCGERIESAYAD
jgi:hypothetical protein